MTLSYKSALHHYKNLFSQVVKCMIRRVCETSATAEHSDSFLGSSSRLTELSTFEQQ